MQQLQKYENFWDWKKACDTQCLYSNTTPLSSTEFLDEINDFCKAQETVLKDYTLWQERETTQSGELYYLQKIEVEVGTELAFHGDVHGDITSCNAFIEFLAQKNYLDKENPFKMSKPNFKIIMLGDYTDRGNHGLEVLFTVMRMKKINPTNFFMLRGNHEDVFMNENYGFSAELSRKHISCDPILKAVKAMYYQLPVALYLLSGTIKKNALQCCHGGMEIGHLGVKKLLDDARPVCYCALKELYRKTAIDDLPVEYKKCFRNVNSHVLQDGPIMHLGGVGYSWDDFIFRRQAQKSCPVTLTKNRLQFPEQLTKYLLARNSTSSCTLRGIFRAHQHSPQTLQRILNLDGKSEENEAGVAKIWLDPGQKQPSGKLWDGIVCTFSVSPNAGYNMSECLYNFDSFGILTTDQEFTGWNLTMYQLCVKNMYPQETFSLFYDDCGATAP